MRQVLSPNRRKKPYMGWSSWSFYQNTVTEAAVKAQADVVADKLKPFGYVYVNVDDSWQKGFDEHGYWKANPTHLSRRHCCPRRLCA